jgi:hypothetical protein
VALRPAEPEAGAADAAPAVPAGIRMLARASVPVTIVTRVQDASGRRMAPLRELADREPCW